MSTEAVKAQEKSAKTESKPLGKKIYDGIEWLTSSLTYISILAVLLIIALTVIDVVGRKFFNSPLAGTVGMVQLLMVVVIYLVVGYTTIKNGHVVVDVITGKLPKKGQNYLIFVCTLICFAFAALMTWRTAVLVGSYAAMNSYDKTTLLPLAPFVALVSIGCGLMTLAFFASLTVYFTDSGKNIRQILTKVIPGVAIMLLLGALLIWAKELPEM
jgi:TRAP-type C4-dicarboxylate transport system permease small subunit